MRRANSSSRASARRPTALPKRRTDPLRAVRAAGRAGPRRGGEGGRARLLEVLQPAADRVRAPCRHFGTCGGCALQHLDEGAMRAWKREQVRVAFAQRGMAADVAPTVAITGGRRRAVFAARRRGSGVVLGFHAARASMRSSVSPSAPCWCPRSWRRCRRWCASPSRCCRGRRRRASSCSPPTMASTSRSRTRRAGCGAGEARLARAAAEAGVLRVSVGGEPVYAAGVPLLRFGAALGSRRRAPSCRRWRRLRRRSPRACSACCRRRRSASPTCSAGWAPSPSRSRAAPRCWPSTATVRQWRRLPRRSGARRG